MRKELNNLDEIKTYIYSIDFSSIVDKMVQTQGWKRKHANAACEMYRNYLWLCKKYGDQYKLPPSEEIDEFWHNHILDTQKYRHDCQIIFGRYYDHYPYYGRDTETSYETALNAFKDMNFFYKKEFGKCLYSIRGFFAKFMALFRALIVA